MKSAAPPAPSRLRRTIDLVDASDRRTLAALAFGAALVVLAAGAVGLAVRVFLWASGLGA